jgi:hypothetical protein
MEERTRARCRLGTVGGADGLMQMQMQMQYCLCTYMEIIPG